MLTRYKTKENFNDNLYYRARIGGSMGYTAFDTRTKKPVYSNRMGMEDFVRRAMYNQTQGDKNVQENN